MAIVTEVIEELLRATSGLITTARGRLSPDQWMRVLESAGPEPTDPALVPYWFV